MGIKDLLKVLNPVTRERSIDDFKGLRVAVDISNWIHKGLFAAAEDYVDSGFVDSLLYVDYVIGRVLELRECGLEPILVFDGRRNNLKAETNSKRYEVRLSNIENGKRLLENMKSTKDPTCARKLREEAIACFQRGLHVTHQMETSTIAALRKIGATIIVAPYEADVELVYLCTIGFCQAVMTEDSDVLVYAAVCGLSFPVLYKFDKITRSVQFLELNSFLPVNDLRTGNDICASIGSSTGDKRNKFPSDKENFHSNTPDESIDAHHSELVTDEKGFLNQMKNYNSSASARRMFVQTCVLAGCDYIESIHGVGLVGAQQAILRQRSVGNDLRLNRVVRHYRTSGKTVADNYLLRIQRAESLFFYQPVYNPITKEIRHFIDPVIKSLNESMDVDQQSQCIGSAATVGPAIIESELNQLGSLEEILRTLPAGHPPISSEELCCGMYSMKDFSRITPSFPWVDPKRQRPNHNGSLTRGLWGQRRTLMQMFGTGLPPQQSQHTQMQHRQQNSQPVQSYNQRSISSSNASSVNRVTNNFGTFYNSSKTPSRLLPTPQPSNPNVSLSNSNHSQLHRKPTAEVIPASIFGRNSLTPSFLPTPQLAQRPPLLPPSHTDLNSVNYVFSQAAGIPRPEVTPTNKSNHLDGSFLSPSLSLATHLHTGTVRNIDQSSRQNECNNHRMQTNDNSTPLQSQHPSPYVTVTIDDNTRGARGNKINSFDTPAYDSSFFDLTGDDSVLSLAEDLHTITPIAATLMHSEEESKHSSHPIARTSVDVCELLDSNDLQHMPPTHEQSVVRLFNKISPTSHLDAPDVRNKAFAGLESQAHNKRKFGDEKNRVVIHTSGNSKKSKAGNKTMIVASIKSYFKTSVV